MAFVGVNVGYNDSEGRARAFVGQHKMNYPVLFDQKGEYSRLYRVQGVPTVIVVDKSGTIVSKSFGAPKLSDEEFKKLF